MSKGLGRMVELAEEYGVRTEYYTNGTLLNDRMISMILPTLGQICISFDGASKETFEYLRAGSDVRARPPERREAVPRRSASFPRPAVR